MIYIITLLFYCNLCCGQRMYTHTITVDYSQSLFIQNYNRIYSSQIGHTQPSILGNLDVVNTASISYFKSNYSERFSPGVSFSFSEHNFKKEVNEFYYNIKSNSISFGVGGKYKWFTNSSRFSLNGFGELGVGAQKLSYLESYYNSEVEDIETNSIYYTELKSLARNEIFISPYLKFGVDGSYRIMDWLYLNVLLYFKGVSYPHFDLDSPILFFEVYPGIGISYLFGKNKRYYYD